MKPDFEFHVESGQQGGVGRYCIANLTLQCHSQPWKFHRHGLSQCVALFQKCLQVHNFLAANLKLPSSHFSVGSSSEGTIFDKQYFSKPSSGRLCLDCLDEFSKWLGSFAFLGEATLGRKICSG